VKTASARLGTTWIPNVFLHVVVKSTTSSMTLCVPCSSFRKRSCNCYRSFSQVGWGMEGWCIFKKTKLCSTSSVMTRGHHSQWLLGRLRISGLSVEAIPLEGSQVPWGFLLCDVCILVMLEPCQGRGLDPFDGIEVVALSAASVKWEKVRRETFQRIFWRVEKHTFRQWKWNNNTLQEVRFYSYIIAFPAR